MSRPFRIEFPNTLYYITSRGNERKAIYSDDTDRGEFLGILAAAAARFNWIIHAYCLKVCSIGLYANS